MGLGKIWKDVEKDLLPVVLVEVVLCSVFM